MMDDAIHIEKFTIKFSQSFNMNFQKKKEDF